MLHFVIALIICTRVIYLGGTCGAFEMTNPQRAALDEYLKQLVDLREQRERAERRMSKIERVMRGMIDLLETEAEQMEYMERLDEIKPPAGLTEAIQQVLQSEDRPFFPTEVRDRVRAYLVRHSNKMASVHTTLKRLCKQPFAFVEAVEKDGRTAYQSSVSRIRREAEAANARKNAAGEKCWP
jgi:hypothetical protein